MLHGTNHAPGVWLALAGLAVSACATPIVIDQTPSVVPRSTESPIPRELTGRREAPYALDATVDPNGTRIDGVRAIANGEPWPMIPEGGEMYRGVVVTSPCTNTLTYAYEVDYRRPRVLGRGYGRLHTLRTPRVGGYLLTVDGELPPGCPATEARVFEVDTTVDDVDADVTDGLCATAKGRCSLRAAIMQANATEGHDVIRVPAGTYALTSGPETVDVPDPASGDLDITDGVSVEGQDEATVIIDGGGPLQRQRIFDVHLPVDERFVRLSRLTLQRGAPEDAPGGAIFNRGQLQLDRVRFHENSLRDTAASCNNSLRMRVCNRGGAIFNEGRMLVQRSTFTHNRACSSDSCYRRSGQGGAISNFGNEAYLRIEASTFADNSARFVGAVMNLEGTVEIVNSTLHENAGAWASTISTWGGNVEVDHTTVVANTVEDPVFDVNGGGRLVLGSSIVTKNLALGDICRGAVVSAGWNYLNSSDPIARRVRGCTLTPAIDAVASYILLGALEDNGGPTPTMSIRRRPPDSSRLELVDGAVNGLLCPATDQRGYMRPRDGDGDGIAVCDPGAYEASEPGT